MTNVLSVTEFHNWVEFSFDMDIIPFAVPLRMKSAYDEVGDGVNRRGCGTGVIPLSHCSCMYRGYRRAAHHLVLVAMAVRVGRDRRANPRAGFWGWWSGKRSCWRDQRRLLGGEGEEEDMRFVVHGLCREWARRDKLCAEGWWMPRCGIALH